MSAFLPQLPLGLQMQVIFLSCPLKPLCNVTACSCDAAATPSHAERGRQSLYAQAGSPGALHARHRVSLGATEV